MGAGPTIRPRTAIGSVPPGLPISVDLAHGHSPVGTRRSTAAPLRFPSKKRPSRNFLNPNSNKFSLQTPSPGLLSPSMTLRGPKRRSRLQKPQTHHDLIATAAHPQAPHGQMEIQQKTTRHHTRVSLGVGAKGGHSQRWRYDTARL